MGWDFWVGLGFVFVWEETVIWQPCLDRVFFFNKWLISKGSHICSEHFSCFFRCYQFVQKIIKHMGIKKIKNLRNFIMLAYQKKSYDRYLSYDYWERLSQLTVNPVIYSCDTSQQPEPDPSKQLNLISLWW